MLPPNIRLPGHSWRGAADALSRDRYARGEGEKAGKRNGYRTGKVKTAEGAVEYSARRAWEKHISQVPSRVNRTQEACYRSAQHRHNSPLEPH